MATINLENKDYVLNSLDAVFAQDEVQAICMRLAIHRRKYWANKNLGSRFYTIKRSKDVPRMVGLVKQIADEALQDLVPSRFDSIHCTAYQKIKSRIELDIEAVRLTGEKQTIQYFVAVGG